MDTLELSQKKPATLLTAIFHTRGSSAITDATDALHRPGMMASCSQVLMTQRGCSTKTFH